jgi:hypothetical protein
MKKIIKNYFTDNEIQNKLNEIEYFCNLDKSVEILRGKYIYGKSTAFFKDKEDKIYKQVETGGENSSGQAAHYSLRNYLATSDYKRDLDLYWDKVNNKAFIKNKSSFTFLEVESISKEDFLNTEFIELPEFKYITKLVLIDNEKYLLISNTQFKNETEIYLIEGFENITKLEVNDIQRYRDGGTTYYHTNAGIIYTPTPLKNDEINPTFNKRPAQNIDIKLEFPIYVTLAMKTLNIQKTSL